MTTLYNIEVDVDIDPLEFIESCSTKDTSKIINYLTKNGFISDWILEGSKVGIWEGEFIEKLDTLKSKYYSISNEDLELITKIYLKYG